MGKKKKKNKAPEVLTSDKASPNKRDFIISPSSLDKAMTCERQYKHLHLERLGPKTEPKYFAEGAIAHKILEVYYKSIIKHKKEISPAARINIARQKGFDYAQTTNLELDDIEKIIQATTDSIAWHSKENWKPVAVEKKFVILLYEGKNVNIHMQGRIDLIVKVPKMGIVTVDHKTAGQQLIINDLDNQFICYCWASGTNTMIINQIGKQKTVAPDKKFRRIPFNVNAKRIEDWKRQAIWHSLHMVKCIDQEHFPMRHTGCKQGF